MMKTSAEEPTHSKPLSAVIVGCGGFANNYLGIYRQLSAVQPILCYDINKATAVERAQHLGGVASTTNFETAKATAADFAVVSTPNDMHLEHAGELLRSGKHVLVQKPLARSLSEAQALHGVARSCPDQKLGVYMNMLDFDLWWDLRAAVRDRMIFGDVVELNIRLGHTGGLSWRKEDTSSWRLKKDKTGGGAFVMLGVHYLHLMRWLTGFTVQRVCAQTANLHCPHVEGEDICLLRGELSNGAFFQLTTAWNSQGEHFTLYGTKGSFAYLDNELVRIHGGEEWRTSHFDYCPTKAWQSFANVCPPALDASGNPYNQHIQFATAIRDGGQPAVDSAEGLCDMRIVDAAYRSATSGQWEIPNET